MRTGWPRTARLKRSRHYPTRNRDAAGGALTQRPIVVSFVPSAGGVGNSTLAIETAMQLVANKAAKNSKIALIDLDFGSSHVCDYLDISPKFQLDEIIAAPERLDDQLMSVFVSRHASGLEVFAASRNRFQRRDLGVDALSALFERMAHRYGYIIVDLPLSLHAWTIPLLTASEGILVTGVNTIPGLRQIAETLRAIASSSQSPLTFERSSTSANWGARQYGAGGPCRPRARRGQTAVGQEHPGRARMCQCRNPDDGRLSVRQVCQGHRRDSGILPGAEATRAPAAPVTPCDGTAKREPKTWGRNGGRFNMLADRLG